MMSLNDIRIKVNNILSNLQENDPEVKKISDFFDAIKPCNNVFWDKIIKDNWVNAADPSQICKTDQDKEIRASTIYSLLMAKHIYQNKSIKVLDFGSGEGHISKHISNSGVEVYSYDIKDENKCNINFTTYFNEINSRKYDIIFVYDVLDHSVEEDPVEVLKKIKSLLNQNGKVILRCHPWSSRHGTHLWSLNKAYAHLFLTDEELEKLGHKGIPTVKITHPSRTYNAWFKESGFNVQSESIKQKACGIFIENGYEDVKKHIHCIFNNFEWSCIETEFVDYILS